MTSTASINGFLVAGGVLVAAAIWAGAIFLPAPAARGAAPLLPAMTALAPEAPRLQPLAEPVTPLAEPVTPPTVALAIVPDAAPQSAAVAAARIDPAIFGVLQTSMAPPALAQRVSILNAAGAVPLTSVALASTPLQSIGATFGDTVAGVGPELGGASALDGPADSGLDVPVARSGEAEMASAAPPPPRGKILVIDASEGTRIDPLRQRNWDLNAVQVIPAMPTSAPPRR